MGNQLKTELHLSMKTLALISSIAAFVTAFTSNVDIATRGTNMGGWLVLEPWITPTLFYRFLGKTHSEGVGRDSWTFCEALGPVEGKKLMNAHMKSWVTEEYIKALADREVK